MKTSNKGKDLIKTHEELRLKAYLDGGGVPTVGWGHTKGVKLGQTITQEQAETFLTEDLYEAEIGVSRGVSFGLAPHQFDALVSLVFNIGVPAFRKSTLLRKLNNGDIMGAANAFNHWVFDNGKRVKGLVNRRKKERSLFLIGE